MVATEQCQVCGRETNLVVVHNEGLYCHTCVPEKYGKVTIESSEPNPPVLNRHERRKQKALERKRK